MKTIVNTIIALVVSLALVLPVAVAADGITVVVNGNVIDFSGDQPPVIDASGRTLVPVRKVFEKLGSDVVIDYDNAQIMVTINKGITIITMIIDNPWLTIAENGKSWNVLMDTQPVILNGRTMLPARFVAESLGASVSWNPDTYTVSIASDYEVIQNKVGNADLSIVRRDGKYGCIDRDRKIVIPIEYDSIDFNEFSTVKNSGQSDTFNNVVYAIAKVTENGKTFYLGFSKGYTDSSGIYHQQRLDTFDLVENMPPNINKSYVFVQKNGKWGIIDMMGEEAVAVEYDEKPIIINPQPPRALVKKYNMYGISSLDNHLLTGMDYSVIGYKSFKQNQKGNPWIYYQGGYVCAMRDSVFGYIDINGKEVSPFRFQGVEPLENGVGVVTENGVERRIKIDSSGHITYLPDTDSYKYYDDDDEDW